jgi:hypothetical protein
MVAFKACSKVASGREKAKKGQISNTIRGGHLRPQMGVLLKCELMAKTGNNQAQFPEVAADST